MVVYSATGDILVMRRADLPDFWQSVTGSLDPGEAPAETAVRELYEETGIRAVHSGAATVQAYRDACQQTAQPYASSLASGPLSGPISDPLAGLASDPSAGPDPVLSEHVLSEPVPLFDCRSTNQYPIRSVWRRRYAPGITHNTEHVFLAQVPTNRDITLAAAEHTAFEWLAPAKALERLTSPTNRAAVTQWLTH